MSRENLDRIGTVVDQVLLDAGQTCCHRMQISDVPERAYTARILLNCDRHWAIGLDVEYTTGEGDKSDAALKENIALLLRAQTPRYGRNVRVRITSRTNQQDHVGTVVGFKGHTTDAVGWVEEYWVKFEGDESGPYPYADHDFTLAD